MVEPVSMLGPGNGINWGWESTAAAADDDDDDDDCLLYTSPSPRD